MKRYFVQSGRLRITLVAVSAYDAALEAVRWWDDSQLPPAADAAHRASLDAVIEVRSSRTSRPPRLFPTIRLLARAAGESPSQAWERVLRQHVGSAN
jgi:hypothetical protein